jgi:butyryl-CoA dehydrogenase
MFHMMNEARIGVGLGATMLGAAGYEASLAYAKQRTQGRPIGAGGKDASAPPVRLIEHADIRRMLLAQKAYVEGGMALALSCARLVDEQRTGTPEASAEASLLLEMLTPIAKSWPSEWALEANSLAIQIHGGYGYTRDFPVEQHWRDNRLNMIHEGTHGIQGLDLLGRKAVMQGGAGLKLLAHRIDATIARALPQARLATHANALAQALQRLGAATRSAWATAVPEDALANATPYLQAFGHTILAWLWLDVGATIVEGSAAESTANVGRLAALDYFMRYELPKTDAWLRVVESRDRTCRDVPEDAF